MDNTSFCFWQGSARFAKTLLAAELVTSSTTTIHYSLTNRYSLTYTRLYSLCLTMNKKVTRHTIDWWDLRWNGAADFQNNDLCRRRLYIRIKTSRRQILRNCDYYFFLVYLKQSDVCIDFTMLVIQKFFKCLIFIIHIQQFLL